MTKFQYLASYIDAMRSTKLDGKLFATLAEQEAFFRGKSMNLIPWAILNQSELARQSGLSRARIQDIQRGKTKATADDLSSVLIVLHQHFG